MLAFVICKNAFSNVSSKYTTNFLVGFSKAVKTLRGRHYQNKGLT
jgi:hypothetical protein